MTGHDPNSILIVEDDTDLAELAGMLLESHGYSVRTAANGAIALAMVAAKMPALILLDLKMPVMDGWEFAQRLRETYEELPKIVVVTAADDARRRAQEVGADGWVSKPYDPTDLVREVKRFLPGEEALPAY